MKIQLKKKFKKHAAWWRNLSRTQLVPIITLGVLIVVCSVGLAVLQFISHRRPPVPDTRIVIISYDDQKQVVPTKGGSVQSLLSKLSIHLNPGDRVEPSLKTRISQDDFRINIYRALPIEIVDGTTKTFAFSAATTPRSIADQTGQTIYAEDELESVPSESFIKDGALGRRIVIDRATPINLDLYGTKVATRTQATTFEGLLKEKNIKLEKGDQLVPAANTPLSTNMSVAIIRNGTKVQTETEEIAMPVRTIPDANLSYGTSAVRQAGSSGKKIVTYQVELKNNQVISKKVLQEVVVQAAVEQVVVAGTSLSGIKGDMGRAGISPGDYMYADYIISHESGWCPTKKQGQYGGCPPLVGEVPSYGGYGLCQATPGNKMASAGADWRTNPITQLKWCSGYAKSRHGGWGGAYSFWLRNHWW